MIRLTNLLLENEENANYWYHITEQNWPNRILLKPRESGENWGSDEGGPARISVAPTIEQCFAAVPYSEYNSDYRIYRTLNKVPAEKAGEEWVPDVNITDEHWIYEPTIFIKIDEIPLEDIKKFPKMTVHDFYSSHQKKVIEFVRQYLKGRNDKIN